MELTDELFSAYNLGTSNLQVVPIRNGLINTTWRIDNSYNSYILQKVNDQIFKIPENIACNVRMVADYLQKHHPDYFFISPIQTNNGQEMVHFANNGYFRLIPFVKNSYTINTVEMPQQAFQAAKKFGEFTRLLSAFPVEKLKITLPDFHNLKLRYQQFLEALENGNELRLKESKEYIQFINEHKNIVDVYESILHNPSFKLRVTHHDTKISNVLFDSQNRGLCVIDLDTLMPGYFISDVGDMMRTYLSPVNEEEKDFSKIEIREAYFKSIWDGYMSEMGSELNVDERNHFIYAGKFMIYMQAIRFLTDHLNNDTYYGAKYEGQNFIRAGNQIVLLKKLIAKENVLKTLIKK